MKKNKKNKNHRVACFCLYIVVLAAALGAFGCGQDQDPAKRKATAFPDSISDTEYLAWINGHPVMGKELRAFTLMYRAGTVDSLVDRSFNLRMLEGLIDRTLLWQEANAIGLAVDDSTTQWYLQQFIRSAGGAQAVDRQFAEVGISRFDLQNMVEKDLVIRRFLEVNIAQGIQVSDSVTRAYYDTNIREFETGDSVEARHIILRSSPGDTEEAVEQKKFILNDLRARAAAGESFADLAKEYSEGPTGPEGGYLGTFARRDMVRPFSDAAFALKAGEVSDVVQTSFGYHLIKVEKKIPSRTLGYEEVRLDLMRQIQQYLIQQKLQNHLQRSRAVAIIEKNF